MNYAWPKLLFIGMIFCMFPLHGVDSVTDSSKLLSSFLLNAFMHTVCVDIRLISNSQLRDALFADYEKIRSSCSDDYTNKHNVYYEFGCMVKCYLLKEKLDNVANREKILGIKKT